LGRRRRAGHRRRHHRARRVCPAPRRHAASAATAARGDIVGGTAPPRQVRSPLRRSRLLAASLALCVLTRPFVVRFLGAAVTCCVTRAAAAIVASSESVSPRRFPPRQNGPLVWLGAFTGDGACAAVVRVGWGARCALCCCAAATGAVVVSAWRRWQQRRTYGGIGGTGRWRRVVAVGTSADAPGLPGNFARSPAAARAV
jgi:hypothetical protein